MMLRIVERASKINIVLRAYRRYMECKREFNKVAERFALKGWPDRKAPLGNAYKLQALLNDRQALRLDHLANALGQEVLDWRSLTSVSAIFKRLNEEWSDAEEEALKTLSPGYKAC